MAIEVAPLEPTIADARARLRDQRTLWRFAAWGGTAALALLAVAITAQTESGAERLQFALAESPPARAIVAEVAPRPAEKDAETQRLEAQLRALAADRDRLTARLATVEHSLDDVTGSIKRQTALAAALPQIPSTIPPASAPAVAAAAPSVVVPAMLPKTEAAAPRPDAPPPAATAAPDAVPLPPVRVASAPANEPAAEPPPPAKIEFGIDIGGAPTVEALRARWAAVKANFGPLLNGLTPVAAHDHRPGGTGYRLVVGPLPNTAAAARLCNQFTAVRIACRSAKFDGERMALR